MAGLYYEQFTVGMEFDHALRRTVTEMDNIMFCALTHNPQPLHLDEEFAKQTEFGQRIVNSLFTLGLVVTMPLKVAEAIIDSAIETRREEGMLPLTVAVLDAGGILVSLKREDGCGIMRGDIAIGKAWGALGFHLSPISFPFGQQLDIFRGRVNMRENESKARFPGGYRTPPAISQAAPPPRNVPRRQVRPGRGRS